MVWESQKETVEGFSEQSLTVPGLPSCTSNIGDHPFLGNEGSGNQSWKCETVTQVWLWGVVWSLSYGPLFSGWSPYNPNALMPPGKKGGDRVPPLYGA